MVQKERRGDRIVYTLSPEELLISKIRGRLPPDELKDQDNGSAKINVGPLASLFAESVFKKLGLTIEKPEENLN